MYHDMYGHSGDGWHWLWMALMMLLWLAVFGGVVYTAVRLAIRPRSGEKGVKPVS